jgi:hypothetical protein
VLRRIFGTKKDEVTEKFWTLGLHMKSRRLQWAGHVDHKGKSETRPAFCGGGGGSVRKVIGGRKIKQDNIKMDVGEVGYEVRRWLELAQGRV